MLDLLVKVIPAGIAQDPDPLDTQDFGFLDPVPQKYADPWIRINQKLQKKTFFLLNPKSEFFKKEKL